MGYSEIPFILHKCEEFECSEIYITHDISIINSRKNTPDPDKILFHLVITNLRVKSELSGKTFTFASVLCTNIRSSPCGKKKAESLLSNIVHTSQKSQTELYDSAEAVSVLVCVCGGKSHMCLPEL